MTRKRARESHFNLEFKLFGREKKGGVGESVKRLPSQRLRKKQQTCMEKKKKEEGKWLRNLIEKQ